MFAAPPQIIKDFRPNTVIAEGQGIQFRCIAQGYPIPTISWEHAGQSVVNGDNPHFEVNSISRNDGLLVTVTSFLTVSSADDSVSGEVRCIALPPPPDMVGGMALDRDDTSTQLSILGNNSDLVSYTIQLLAFVHIFISWPIKSQFDDNTRTLLLVVRSRVQPQRLTYILYKG